MADDIEINLKGLEQLEKALKRKAPEIRLGILGDGGMREDGLTNAEVGAIHEFGTTTAPVRSFLRMPLTEKLNDELEKSGAFTLEALGRVIQMGSLVPWCQKVAVCAEAVIADAFDTGGFGKWPPSDMRNKKVHQTLVESQQLRNSITSEVKE